MLDESSNAIAPRPQTPHFKSAGKIAIFHSVAARTKNLFKICPFPAFHPSIQ